MLLLVGIDGCDDLLHVKVRILVCRRLVQIVSHVIVLSIFATVALALGIDLELVLLSIFGLVFDTVICMTCLGVIIKLIKVVVICERGVDLGWFLITKILFQTCGVLKTFRIHI